MMDTLLPLSGCSLMIISLGFVITFWFRAMSAFDKLVKYEYENLPEQWERDGQPRGMFWKPQEKRVSLLKLFFLSNPAIAVFRFLFQTPQWVQDNSEPTVYIRQFRKFTLFWNVGAIAWFVVIFPAILIVFTPS
jgi:hypothetical protein